MTTNESGACRRCGTEVPATDQEFTHYLFVRLDEGTEIVALRMCRPCAGTFPSPEKRGAYARASYLD